MCPTDRPRLRVYCIHDFKCPYAAAVNIDPSQPAKAAGVDVAVYYHNKSIQLKIKLRNAR